MLIQKLRSLAHRLLPCCPSRLRLPFLAWIYSVTGGEPEIACLNIIGPCRGIAIDVGANYGFYALAMSRLYNEVVAFEPNQSVATPLISAGLKGVKIIHAGVSSKTGRATLFVPRLGDVVLSGWASLGRDNCPEATGFDCLEISLCTLDSFQFENVGFIKIDVEGHELSVIQGGAETIKRDKPHLLVEVRAEHLPELQSLLSEWGYVETTLKALGGPGGTLGNHLFIPANPPK